MESALDRLFPGDEPVLLDGAMGTSLREQGWPVSEATVLANLQAPGLVATVHDRHRDAGARILHSNTFGALMGEPHDHARRLDAVRAGVRIAREAAGSKAIVAGSLGAFDLAFAGPHLDDVVRALIDEGVDLLVFEACNAARDARAALEMRHEYGPQLPAVVCASTTDGSHDDRHRVEEVATTVRAHGHGALFGLNCCRGPHDALRTALALAPTPRWIKPSTGLPGDAVDDNVMAAFARAARLRGARFLGGCCGTTEDTLTVMAAALAP